MSDSTFAVNQPQRSESSRPLLVARNSGERSTSARRAVAADIHHVAEALVGIAGIDVRAELPSEDEILARLRVARVVASVDANGKTFKNEYLPIRLPSCDLFLSTGSGHKTTEDYIQPFLDELVAEVKILRPGLIAFSRYDRILRTPLLGADLLHVLKELGTAVCDVRRGKAEQLNDMSALFALFEASSSSDEADKIPTKTRLGQRRHTDDQMNNGRARYAAVVTPPPSLMVFRSKTESGVQGGQMLYLDTPANYPGADEVAYGLPNVRINGVQPDQVALVQWALSNLGKPGMGRREVGRYLASQGFSTERLRRRSVSGETTADLTRSFADVDLGKATWRVVRPILSSLDFYKTGVFHVKLGVAEVEDIEIHGCFPANGDWASDEDFQRIEKFLEESPPGGGPARLGLVGVRVNTTEGPATLIKAPERRDQAGASYQVQLKDQISRRRSGYPAIPHLTLAESIVIALEKHADELLIPLAMTELPQVSALRAQVTKAQVDLDRTQARADAMLVGFGDVDADGKPLLGTETRMAIARKHEEQVTKEVRPRRVHLEQLQAELRTLTASLMQGEDGLSAAVLLQLVKSLRDPKDTTFNALWKRSITIDEISRKRVWQYETTGTITTWQGTIKISGGGYSFAVPWEGSHHDGAVLRIDVPVEDAIAAMHRGAPFRHQLVRNPNGVRQAIAERLGYTTRRCGVTDCDHPFLVRIAIRLATDHSIAHEDIAKEFNVPAELVTDVQAQLDKGRRTWKTVINKWTDIIEKLDWGPEQAA